MPTQAQITANSLNTQKSTVSRTTSASVLCALSASLSAIGSATADVAARGPFPADQTQFFTAVNKPPINHLTHVSQKIKFQKQTQFSPRYDMIFTIFKAEDAMPNADYPLRVHSRPLAVKFSL